MWRCTNERTKYLKSVSIRGHFFVSGETNEEYSATLNMFDFDSNGQINWLSFVVVCVKHIYIDVSRSPMTTKDSDTHKTRNASKAINEKSKPFFSERTTNEEPPFWLLRSSSSTISAILTHACNPTNNSIPNSTQVTRTTFFVLRERKKEGKMERPSSS